jgi:acetate CoA/acetoacetate CoA-transferase alpha subunit
MSKLISLEDAVARIPDGASLLIGGFMAVGGPNRLVDELIRQRKSNLTIIANDTARPNVGLGKLVVEKLVAKVVTSHIGLNPETQKQMISGDIQVELVPQGTLVERIRSGGVGLGGVLTPTGVGTSVEEGKRTVEIDGKIFLLELPIKADFALIAAKQADLYGNLTYALTSRNFNPIMALAGATVIAEAEDIVPVGCIPPDAVMTPSVLVDHIVTNAKR